MKFGILHKKNYRQKFTLMRNNDKTPLVFISFTQAHQMANLFASTDGGLYRIIDITEKAQKQPDPALNNLLSQFLKGEKGEQDG